MKPLVVALLLLGSLAESKAPAPGRYGADTTDPGFVQLVVEKDGTVTFLHVVTLHLPPFELERHAARLVRGPKGSWCMEPAPKDALPCLTQARNGKWLLTLKQGNTVLTLLPESEPVPR